MKFWTCFSALPLLLAVSISTLAAAESEPLIVLAGDSTVAPNGGWGDGFAKLLSPGVKCLNLAKGGRSSKSFRAEGHWQQVLDAKPSWVLIQFGHNDQPGKGPERETDPKTTFTENMARYVVEVQAAGGKPVLVTSLTRRSFDAQGKIKPDGLAPYVEAVRALAAERHVPLVDLNARSVELLERLGPEKAADFNRPTRAVVLPAPVPGTPNKTANPDAPGPVDRTHLSALGEQETAKLVAEEIRAKIPELAKLLKAAK